MFDESSSTAMELGEVFGLHGNLTMSASKESDLSLIKRANITQAASYTSPFLDEQRMLRFSKNAHTLPSGLDFGRPNEQRLLLSRAKRPFTPSQWMELEHQALIYKYLNAKAPIPSSLLISISKSFRSASNRMSWRPLYPGFPANADTDPEPGRCRRTDGKKWRCSKEAMADHKYCERHINRNRHRSRKPVENQPKKTAKETSAAGALSTPVSLDSFKKAKVNDLQPGSVSYWTESLNRTLLSREKANKPVEDKTPLLNSANQQPTLSLLSQLKQHNKPEKFSSTLDCESISSNAVLKSWGSSNQESNKPVSSILRNDHEYLHSVLQDFSLTKNEKIESEKRKASNSILTSTFCSSPEDQCIISCLQSNMTLQDSIPSSWEMPQGGPLGEILTNPNNTEKDPIKKSESRSYGWLLNLENQTT